MYDYVQTGKLKCDGFPCDPSAGYKPVKHIYTSTHIVYAKQNTEMLNRTKKNVSVK